MPRKFLLISVCFLLLSLISKAQVSVEGYFLKDSIKIGESLPYVLTAQYPSEESILFPDSTYSFFPFEFESKHFFPTKTVADLSFDSVIYTLSTFEIDSVQRLGLPVFVVHPMDCTQVNASRDSIFLQLLIAQVPDSVSAENLPLRTFTEYLDVRWLFNYPILLIGFASLIILLGITWIIFGKKIRRYFLVKKLNKKHFAFLDKFGSLTQSANLSITQAEDAVGLWKKYIEDLANQPFTKYTTKEIRLYENNEPLIAALQSIDRMIYGGIVSSTHSFNQLRDYTESVFQKKIEEVTHE